MSEPAERKLDDLIAKTVAVMESYGVKDPWRNELNNEDRTVLHHELKRLMPRGKPGPKRDRGRFMYDMIIFTRLSMAEPELREASGRVIVGGRELPQPKSISKAARDLADDWAAQGEHVDWKSIRARYYKLRARHNELQD